MGGNLTITWYIRKAVEAEEALQKAQADQAKAWRKGPPESEGETAASPQATEGSQVEERQQVEAAAPAEQPSVDQSMSRSHDSQGAFTDNPTAADLQLDGKIFSEAGCWLTR